MSESIRLSAKHGLNPGIPVCFYCGEQKNEIILFGKIGKGSQDLEAPHNFITDYEPCDKCREKIGEAIVVLGVLDHENVKGQAPIARNPIPLYPPGVWCAMKKEAVQRVFSQTDEEMEKIIRYGKFLVDSDLLKQLIQSTE